MVVCLERGVDLHMVQLMPLPLTVSCFSKIQIGFSFLVPAHRVVPDKGPLNVCVCVCVCVLSGRDGRGDVPAAAGCRAGHGDVARPARPRRQRRQPVSRPLRPRHWPADAHRRRPDRGRGQVTDDLTEKNACLTSVQSDVENLRGRSLGKSPSPGKD